MYYFLYLIKKSSFPNEVRFKVFFKDINIIIIIQINRFYKEDGLEQIILFNILLQEHENYSDFHFC